MKVRRTRSTETIVKRNKGVSLFDHKICYHFTVIKVL